MSFQMVPLPGSAQQMKMKCFGTMSFQMVPLQLENVVLSDSFVEVILVTENLFDGEKLLDATKCKAEEGEKGFWVSGRAMFDYKITFDDDGDFEEERYSWYGYWFAEFEEEEEEEEDNDTEGENE